MTAEPMQTLPQLSGDSWIHFLKSVDGPTLSNAIEMLGVRPREEGFAPLDVRCLFPELSPMAGYAVTAQVETVTRTAEFDVQQFIDLYRAVEKAPKPAVIVFQEIGARPEFAGHCGEVMAEIFVRLGAVGLVSDCGVRDVGEVRKLGFQYFARGAVSSHAHFRVVQSGVPVQVRGMVIQPGQAIYGDENGVLVIPDGAADRLPGAVESIRQKERALLEFVRSSEFSVDAFEKMVKGS